MNEIIWIIACIVTFTVGFRLGYAIRENELQENEIIRLRKNIKKLEEE